MSEDFRPLTYLSVCSGIEAATVAWKSLGWKPIGFAEIDKFPSTVLAHHYPHVRNYGDFTQIKLEDLSSRPDILVGGTPCQSFSIAGKRAGLDDPRGNLTLEFARLADRLRPPWLVWENVPGVLPIDGGRTFGAFLGALGKIGYGFAYRVCDAQHFGVPQRRRRVFLIGHLGDWRRAAAVLFERQSLQGHTPPSREKRKSAPTIPSRRSAGGGLGTDFDCDGGLITNNTGGPIELTRPTWWDGGQVSQTLDAVLQKGQMMPEKNRFPAVLVPQTSAPLTQNPYADNESRESLLVTDTIRSHPRPGSYNIGNITVTHSLRAICENPLAGPDGVGVREDDTAYTVEARQVPQAVAFQSSQSGVREVDAHATLDSNNGSRRHNGVVQAMQVRRLTPEECEKLQGFPPGYTKISEKTADGPRYKALGNSFAVPVVHWIGRRIQLVDLFS